MEEDKKPEENKEPEVVEPKVEEKQAEVVNNGNESNGMAIASLILGIISILFNFIGYSWIGLILGIVGIILGVNAKKKNPSSMASAGLVLSIIGTALCAVIFYCLRCMCWHNWIRSFFSLIVKNILRVNRILSCLPDFL